MNCSVIITFFICHCDAKSKIPDTLEIIFQQNLSSSVVFEATL